MEKYGDKKQDLKSEINQFEKEIKDLLVNQEKIQREKSALMKKKEYLSKKFNEKEKLKATIQILDKEKSKDQKALEKKQKQFSSFSDVDFDIDSFKVLQEDQKKFNKEYEHVFSEFNKISERFSKITLNLEKTQSSITVLKQKIKSVQDQKKEHIKMKEQIKKEQKTVSELLMIRDVMVSFRQHLISRIRPILSNYATFLFHDLTDGKYPELTLDEQYNIEIYDEGQSYMIQRFSGGEIDLANLSLRLAISDVITERAGGLFQFIILDEIFGSQDAIRQQNIMNQLYKLSNKFKQIFLITHIENVKHYMQHIINVSEIDGLSSVKIN